MQTENEVVIEDEVRAAKDEFYLGRHRPANWTTAILKASERAETARAELIKTGFAITDIVHVEITNIICGRIHRDTVVFEFNRDGRAIPAPPSRGSGFQHHKGAFARFFN